MQLDSRNHILLEGEPAWERFKEAVLEFTGRAGRVSLMPGSERSRSASGEILAALVAGRSNSEIGAPALHQRKDRP